MLPSVRSPVAVDMRETLNCGGTGIAMRLSSHQLDHNYCLNLSNLFAAESRQLPIGRHCEYGRHKPTKLIAVEALPRQERARLGSSRLG